jgi:hypothetical protein
MIASYTKMENYNKISFIESVLKRKEALLRERFLGRYDKVFFSAKLQPCRSKLARFIRI